ncbi:hypothetical protein [Bifidobacterium sp. SO1]|uniref:hypothetical protein n=1 Tax=Bifidobacterium sp. SO1 TaxID=2809029 RepID=UPI001BDD287D|nr:hypothetical protein [Bifidobacterium sp. SO1]MBT1161854.1 hypothetical protein [Bifidobacterium sp. SO1]
MTRTSEYGGIEYALQRVSDHAWLYDGDLDGEDTAWEPDADDATWLDTKDDVIRMADRLHLANEDGDGPADGYMIMERDWVNEEEITEEYETPEPRPAN